MKKLVFAMMMAVLVVSAGTPALAGGVFDDSSDWGHFVAGMIVQEIREDARNEQRREEERQRQEELRRQEELARQREERARHKGNWYEVSKRPDLDYHPVCADCKSKMQVLLDIDDQIKDEVLEESLESRELVLEIYEDNGRDLEKTAQDIRPFVYEYFAVFCGDQNKMYDLWVSTKFEKWLNAWSR